jgi:C1A family cysteine protease
MKKITLILFIYLVACANSFSQKVPMLAPLNPDFINFITKLGDGGIPVPGSDSFGTGGMPPPGLISFDDYLNTNQLKSVTFAPVYDMRTTNFLTPVRGQTNNGCWAFATMASVESRWLVLGLGIWDLSENNLKYCHGFDANRSYYGNHWMSTAYFARRTGALTEADDPNLGGSPAPGQCPVGKKSVAYITDARYLPHDNNTIKQAILNQGSIFTMLYYVSTYYNPVNFTYYYSGAPQVNHCVSIVGWDDNKVTSGGTGAWICKNSYGVAWGEAGFFYVSYADKGILNYNAYWPVRSDNLPNSTIYGYDDLGNYQSVGYAEPLGYTLVKFVATGKQLLSKVGTYAMGSNATLDIDVFDNFDPVTKILSGQFSHQSGLACAMPGYYTFDLATQVTIEQGNDFYIRVRYLTPTNNNPIPIERVISGYSVPFIESDVAWVSDSGNDGSWFAIGNSTNYYKWDPCVKVYAEALRTWKGMVSGDWNTAANWSPGSVPDAGINVIVPDVANSPIVNQPLSSPAVCNNLTIDAGSSLVIRSGKALTVNGNLINSAGNGGLVIESGASLITRGNVCGAATLKKNIGGDEWHLISPPISDAISNIFLEKYLQRYIEATDTYLDIISETEHLAVSTGYAVFYAEPFVATYSGLLNTGPVGNSDNLSNAGLGWNLVGNPYPSSIDWDASGWTKTNLSDAIYFPVNSTTWASYVGGVGTNGGSQYIAPGQGFFVHVNGYGPGTLAMNNAVRVHNTALFLKNSSDKLVRLNVSGNGYFDETVIRFLPEATTGFDDDYDAIKLFGDVDKAAQLYTVGSEPMSINSLPETSSVKLGIRVNTGDVFTVAAIESNGFGALILEDTYTGVFTDLLKSSYSFTRNSGGNEQRFVLRFDPLSVIETESVSGGIYSASGTVHVNLSDNEGGEIFIYSISGQLVTAVHAAPGINKINLADAGNYLVKVITRRNSLVKMVFIK